MVLSVCVLNQRRHLFAIRSQKIFDKMVLRVVLYFGNEHFLSRSVLPPHSLVTSKQPRGHTGLSLISISLEGGGHVQRNRMSETL